MSSDPSSMKKIVHDLDRSLSTDRTHPLNDLSKLKVGGKMLTPQERAKLASELGSVDISTLSTNAPTDEEIPSDLKNAALNKQRSVVAQLRRNTTRESMTRFNRPQSRAAESIIGSTDTIQRTAVEELAALQRGIVLDDVGAPAKPTNESRTNSVDTGEYESVNISSQPTLNQKPASSDDESFDPVIL